MYLTAAFDGKENAAAAIRGLKSGGFGDADLTVFSDEPIEFSRGVLDRPSHMSLASVCGAVLFFLLVVGFVYFTQYNYRLVTGGMPIFSFWATGVVFYEITMLGAIVTTFGWFLWESGLLRRDKRIPVPAIEPGVICLRVSCPADRADQVRRQLNLAGATKVERLQE